MTQGNAVPDAVWSIGVTQVTYYRWRREYGGLQMDQVKRMKDLELENWWLRKAVSGLTLDTRILSEAAKATCQAPARRRQCIDHFRRELRASERRACAALGQHRATQRKSPTGRDDEERMTATLHHR